VSSLLAGVVMSHVPPAIRRPASERIHEAPSKPPAVLLEDARFHLHNAAHSLELAQRALKGDAAERVRVRLRAVKKERARIELFIKRHWIGPSK
jgi:hypothetical protein